MSRFCSLFSGSEANCCFVGAANQGVLIDAGASGIQILNQLAIKGIDLPSIKAVCVTHEHSDHIKGLSALIKKINVPIIASAQTLSAIEKNCHLPKNANLLAIDSTMAVGDIEVTRFATSHDCLGSSGYAFVMPSGEKISVCTDLGVVTDTVRNAIFGSRLVFLESNHDIKMLKNGPYPPELKLRIMGENGHLSNFACASELPKLLNGGTSRFVLAHLSRNNNTPILAKSTAKASFADIGAKEGEDYILEAASVKSEKDGDDFFI